MSEGMGGRSASTELEEAIQRVLTRLRMDRRAAALLSFLSQDVLPEVREAVLNDFRTVPTDAHTDFIAAQAQLHVLDRIEAVVLAAAQDLPVAEDEADSLREEALAQPIE